MFDNGKFEELLAKKDCEGIKLYLQYISYSDKPAEIYSAAKAAYFCVIKTSIPFDFISDIKDSRFTEMLRRFLFCFMRNNPPGASRQRARKALAAMGILRAEPREASLNAIGWIFNEALYRYELTGKTNAFSKPAKKIIGSEDIYAFAPVIKLIEACEGKNTRDMLSYFEREDYLKEKNMREFLRQAGRNIPQEETEDDKDETNEAYQPQEEPKTEEPSESDERAERIKADMLKKRELESLKKKSDEHSGLTEVKTEEAKTEEAKTEEVKTEEAKAEEVKTEEAKAEEVKTEEAKAEEVKTEEAKAEEVKTEEAKAEEVKTEEAKAEEVKTEEAKAEETKTEEVKTEEAKAEEVKAEETKAEEAKTEEVKTEEAKAEEVKTEEAKAEEVKTEEAKAEEVKTEETKAKEVKAEYIKGNVIADKSKALLSSLTELTKSKHEASPSCESAKISDNATEAEDKQEEAAEYIPKDKYDIPIKIAKDQKVNIEPEKPKVSEEIIAAAAAKIFDITTEKKRQPKKENSKEQAQNTAEAEKEYVPKDKYDIPIKIAKDQKVNIEPEKPKVSEEIIAAAAAKIFDIAPIKKKQPEKEGSEEQAQDTAEAEKEYVPKDKYDIPIKIAKDQKVNIEPEKPKVSEEIIAAAAAKIFAIAPIKHEAEPQTSEANKEVFTVPAPKAEEIKTEPKDNKEVFTVPAPKAEEIKTEPKDNKEVFTVPAPKAEEIKTEPQNTEKETISGNLKKIKETPDKELAPDFTARTLEMILESIKNGSDRDMSALREDIRDYFSDGFIMKDMLRRELKVFMSDAELPAHVSQRAMDLLPMLGTAKKKTSISSLLRTISELDEEEPATEIKKPAAVKMPSIEEDLAYNVSDMLMNYLKTVGSFEMKTSMCAEMISKGLKYDEYSKLFDFGLLKSGRILFDKIIPAAKAVVFCKKYEYQKAIPKAKNILLFSFYYMICPDILKMEAFATLKQTGFINYQTADIYKKYALAFAKNSLLNKTIGPAARSLSDQISLKNAPSSRDANLAGRSTSSLIEEFTGMMIKETNSESFEAAIDILHHVSYEDPVLLRSISDLVQPVNYEKALEIAAGLTKRRNTWATSVLVDAASNDFEAIRHKAAFLLGECGPYMNSDAKAQAVSSIVDKMDDCYDEDAQTCYLEAAKKIDQAITAERLILSCMTSGLAERKEKGIRLLEFLDAMKSEDMTKVFAKISNLQALYRFLSSSHKDSFTSGFANKFINLYRYKFVEVYGDEMWSNLLSESENKFSELINNIWNIQF